MIKNLFYYLRDLVNQPVSEKIDHVNNNLNFLINQMLVMKNIEPKPSIKNLQERLFDILEQVHFFFNIHNINYFLIYGTLLGAVRHKGFIPWDDDVDIAMFREDFSKLLDHEKDLMDQNLYLSTPCSRLGYYSGYGWRRIYGNNKHYHISIFVFDLVNSPNINNLLQIRARYHQKATLFRKKYRKGNLNNERLYKKLTKLGEKYYQEADFTSLANANDKTYIVKSLCNYYLPNYSKFSHIFPLKQQEFLVKPEQSIKYFNIPNNEHEVLKDFYNEDYLFFPKNLFPSHKV